jgi:NAD(P)-dependent dehydrogenase (short-subunit alcohol dehydrogenase family)
MDRFSEKVVVVTGAGRGIGLACAESFAEAGASVALVDVNQEEAESEVDRLRAGGRSVLACGCDVSSSEDVRRTVDRVVERFGTVDVLVNNAGVLRITTPMEDIEDAEWDLIMDVNVKGVFLFSKAVLPIMRERGSGKIVNLASSAGRSTSELGGAHYTASKAAVLGLTRHMAREYGSFGINVNSVCPGLVETPMIREEASSERLDHWLGQIPLGRFAEPAEAADLVLFLASEESKYITGATIDFNGGSLLI